MLQALIGQIMMVAFLCDIMKLPRGKKKTNIAYY